MIIFAYQQCEIMETTYRRYPIGIQNFEDLRNNNCVYIDKTELIYRLTHSDKIYFLSRPRRFGKSLLVSTLEAYFQGKKHLFEGLAMERLEMEWTEYPVLHMDFSRRKYTDEDKLSEYVFEFKFDGTPEEALAQIESKNYAIPFQSDGRRIVKIGVNFDSATRTVGEWKIVE